MSEDRDALGRRVREVWIAWAKRQPNPKPSWLVPYDELSEPDKEADRCIGEALWELGYEAALTDHARLLAAQSERALTDANGDTASRPLRPAASPESTPHTPGREAP